MVNNEDFIEFIYRIKSIGITVSSEELMLSLIKESAEKYWREDFMKLALQGSSHGISFNLVGGGVFNLFLINTKGHLHDKLKIVFKIHGFTVIDAKKFIANLNYTKVRSAP